MPQDWFSDLAVPELSASGLAAFVLEVNKRLRRIGTNVDRLDGFGDRVTQRFGDLDLSQNRIGNLKDPKSGKDAVNLRTIQARTLYAEVGESFVSDRPIEAQEGVRVHALARDPFDLVPLTQLEDVSSAIASAAVTTGAAPIGSAFVTIGNDATLTNERALAVTIGELVLTDGGADADVTLGLATTAVTPGTYGDATNVASFTVDTFGRLTFAGDVPITGVPPGPHNLLSASHADTVSGSPPTNGSLIQGFGGLWQEFFVGPDDTVLKVFSGGPVWSFINDANIDAGAQINATKIWNGTVDNTEFGYLDGVTSALQPQLDGKQPASAALDSLAALSGTGAVARIAADTFAVRTFAEGFGIAIDNDDLSTGDPEFSLDIHSLTSETTLASGDEIAFVDVSVGVDPDDQRRTTLGDLATFLGGSFQPLDADLSAIAALSGTGMLARTAANTWAVRTIAGTAPIAVANGDGVVGAPTISLNDTAVTPGTYGSATKASIVTVDQKGRLTAASEATVTPAASSITGGAALTRVDDTNVTLTLGGTPASALLAATSLTLGWTGLLGLARGGTHADLSATGGAGRVLKQLSTGADITVATLTAAEIVSGAALTKTDDANVTLTLGGSPTSALLAATSLTLGWTGLLGLSRGGVHADLSATGGASQVLKQVSAGADITVGQLAFSDISGSVTDAQVPDTITLSNLTQITTRNHSDLAGLTSGDGHTQYVLKAGRTTTDNDFTISTSGAAGTLTGSSASGGNLILTTDSTGIIKLVRPTALNTGFSTLGAGLSMAMYHDQALSFPDDASAYSLINISGTWTTTNSTVLAAASALFNAAPTITNSGAGNLWMHPLKTLSHAPTYLATLASSSVADIGYGAYPVFTFSGAGTYTLTTHTTVQSQPNIDTGMTMGTRRGFHHQLHAGAGAITTDVALDVGALTGTTSAAVRSAITAASTRYFLKDDGGAQSLLKGKFTTYNNITTAGTGLPIIVQEPGVSATKTGNFTVFSATPPAVAGRYRVSAVITTTSSTNTGTVQTTLDYKDSQGTAHTGDIIPLCDAAGSIATTKSGASKEFHSLVWEISIDNSATAIALKVVITGTVSYTVVGTLEQLG